ncbi:MAG TPA: hypothetical protein VFK02_27035 [Kofleriaceae bacterium]|nr:hypothetical protein [Kofleriaceae bacterium]
MHPYRTPSPPLPETRVASDDGGLRLAFRVMTFVGAVQVASELPYGFPPSGQTVFGAACMIAGLVWLLRHREH